MVDMVLIWMLNDQSSGCLTYYLVRNEWYRAVNDVVVNIIIGIDVGDVLLLFMIALCFHLLWTFVVDNILNL